MKVYNRIVFNIETGEVLEEDSYEHEGEVALCGPSDDNTTTVTTMIPEKTIEEHELDKMQLQLMQAQYPLQLELLKYQKEAAEYQTKILPQILANQESLLPAQKAEAEFYVKTMPQQLAIAGKQLGITEKQMAFQEQQMEAEAELFPLQKELYGLQLEQAKKALAGEPLATEEQKKTLRTMTDQFKENSLAGLEDIGETLYEKAVQKGLARGIPLSDIARSFEGEVGKYIASERSSIEREGERMYTSGLANYPTAMAEFAQRISQAPGLYDTTPQVSSGGYASPPMGQIGGVAQMPTSSGGSGGLESLNQMLAQLKAERYGMGTQTQNMPGIGGKERGMGAVQMGLATAPLYMNPATLPFAPYATAAAMTAGYFLR